MPSRFAKVTHIWHSGALQCKRREVSPLSYRVKVKHRYSLSGRVSLEAAAVVVNALRIAVRAQAASLNARHNTRGHLTKLQRESITMSLVGVEKGSGVLVIESESSTQLDVPGAAFSEMIAEINRPQDLPPHIGMQRALLALESLFRRESDVDVEQVEFIDKDGNVARVDFQTMSRILSTFEEQARDEGVETASLTGRLLELDLARQRTFGSLLPACLEHDLPSISNDCAFDAIPRINRRSM
jgi:hypothetical protein